MSAQAEGKMEAYSIGPRACRTWAALAALCLSLAVSRAYALPIPGCPLAGIRTCPCKIILSGTYGLTADLSTSADGDCITVEASGVTLLMGGHSIDHTGVNPKTKAGIDIDSTASNFVLNGGNGTISGFSVGIWNKAANVVIGNVTTTFNANQGVINGGGMATYYKVTSNHNSIGFVNNKTGTSAKLIKCDLSDNTFEGLLLSLTTGAEVYSLTANNNHSDGIALSGGKNNGIFNSTADSNTLSGVLVWKSKDNQIIDLEADSNQFDGVNLKGSSGNTVASFSTSGNSDSGVYIGCSKNGIPDGTSCSPVSEANLIQGRGGGFSKADTNQYGVGIDAGQTANGVFAVEGSANGVLDARDKNTLCDHNEWFSNQFQTAEPACIH
jgi:parallel beta-helix repeat protein